MLNVFHKWSFNVVNVSEVKVKQSLLMLVKVHLLTLRSLLKDFFNLKELNFILLVDVAAGLFNLKLQIVFFLPINSKLN